MARRIFLIGSVILVAVVGVWTWQWHPAWMALIPVFGLVGVGIHDVTQTRHTILRNFPVIGHGRFLFEFLRPEMHQYFIESDTNGRPFSREQRSVVYQRAKEDRDTLPFGTRHDVYAEGVEWIEHSLKPVPPPETPPRVRFGEGRCEQPYDAALLNVSAMSYGALSKAAIRALNGGARDGGFFHNTGEGGLSPYHLEPGGDLVWQIGTGYFGCRTPEGGFDAERFAARAKHDAVKMIEVKLSQGAKPGHGGILPAVKVTEEIARIRGVPMGQAVISPPAHSAFDGPTGLLEFVTKLRELSSGKPVGFKLCVGRRQEVFAILKAMKETGLSPDFITVDGAEGGTGAAPLEFSNAVGWPLFDALALVHGGLTGAGLREKVRLIASGRTIDGFDLAVRLGLGADTVNSARAMMFSLGCIQALRCNANTCPTGVATQDPLLVQGLVVGEKRARVARFQQNTVDHLLELTGAAGLAHPGEITADRLFRRVSPTEVRSFAELYPQVAPGALLDGGGPEGWRAAWEAARPDAF